jgi:hypothetical protein
MTHKAPYAWPPSPARAAQRAPQHSLPPGKLPGRFRARRALKLAAVASIWATGLAVVVIAVAMVAMTTGPGARTGRAGLAAQAADGRAAHGATPRSRAIRPARPALTSQVYSGRGSANTMPFTIGRAGLWKVGWSYSCGSQAAGFVVREAPAPGPAARGIAVTRTATAGHGVAWARHDPGRTALHIRTACAWRVAVTSFS